MTGFDQALSPLGAPAFLKDHWLRTFVHIRGEKARFTPLLPWSDLNAILEQHRLTPPRIKLYRDGQQIDPAQYLTPAMFGVPRLDAGGLAVSLAQGASLILDDVQELAPRVRDLTMSFQDALHSDVFANLYAGWGTRQAFAVHWDAQEAFVLQLCGRKRWKLYRPTRLHPLKNDVAAPPQPSGPPAWDGILEDGDTLYIPRGWWHEAFPLDEPSLHLTVSLTPPTALDYLGWAMARLRRHDELRASLPIGDEAVQQNIAATTAKLTADTLQHTSIADFLREWNANIRPSQHIRLPQAVYEQFSPVTDRSRVRLASLHILSFSSQGEEFVFPAAGRLWTVPKALQPALAKLQNGHDVTVAELADALPTAARADLMRSLGVLAQAGVILVAKG